MTDLYDIIVIGGGRAGTAAAEAAAGAGRKVLVIEHGAAPAPERTVRWDIWWKATAVGLLAGSQGRPHTVIVRKAEGTLRIKSPRVIIATGSLESPRETLRIPGSRPSGVLTPALALDLLDMGLLPGRLLVIYGGGTRAAEVAERVTQGGGVISAWVQEEDFHPELRGEPSSALLAKLSQSVVTGRVTQVIGYPRMAGVQVSLAQGPAEQIPCDTLLVSHSVQPSVAVLKGTAVALDPATHGVTVDATGMTSVHGIFAAGTCVVPDLEHRHSVAAGRDAALAALAL